MALKRLTSRDLRHRITVIDYTDAEDTHGGFTSSELLIASRIPADVQSVVPSPAGAKPETADQITPRVSHLVRIRFRPGIRAGQTVRFHAPDFVDRDMEVVGVPTDPANDKWELHIPCREQDTLVAH